MGLKSLLSKPFASLVHKKNKKWINDPIGSQQRIFHKIISKAAHTSFGRDHNFSQIKDYQDYKRNVPIRDYEGLSGYFNRVVEGEGDVLWPGKPLYLAKTSGTTSGIKYIPITKDSIPNHINSARDALLSYIHETGNTKFLNGKLIFLSGSPEMTKKAGIHVGRLSGIVNHHVPKYLRKNQMPSYATNCIDDWESKLDKIIEETQEKDMTLISGIPPWVQMYFDKLEERTGKKIKDIFPNFNLFVYGGVNFDPYKTKLYESIGKTVDSIETYPASEGFIAYQDSQKEPGLLLLANSGIFFEFVPADEFHDENPTRIMLDQVELNKNYVIIINSNAGLWGYNIGDTVKFVSKSPYRLVVTGRIKHFISAFGEHVIGEEVEKAMAHALAEHKEVEIVEFTVAPFVASGEGKSYHQWFIEFSLEPKNIEAFQLSLNNKLQELNIYYQDLMEGNILSPLKISKLESNAFRNYMKSQGKLGGQNKVPRLSNDRKIADELEKYHVE